MIHTLLAPLQRSTLAAALAGTLAAAPLTACAQFSVMSPEQEQQIGREEHPKIIAQFGGVYDDPEVTGYVAEVGGRLAANSDNPEIGYTFTVLNDPLVNAFALPGGFVYVTRGLMSLANSEAELAGVLAHEIGHVTARHSAQRITRDTVVGLGSVLLGAVLGSQQIGQLAQVGGQLYLRSYSREQEFEADTIGVKVLARTGYAPIAQAEFLQSMAAYSDLERVLAGQRGAQPGSDLFATHPNTADRVRRAIDAAGVTAAPANAPLRRDEYLAVLDGLLYGDDPEQGFIRDTAFLHPGLRIAFEAPEGFRLINSQAAVMAIGPEGAQMRFDSERDPKLAALDPAQYLTRAWGRELSLSDVEQITVDGRPGATGRARANSQQGPVELRLVAVRFPDHMYRLLFVTPAGAAAKFSEAFRRATYSLRALTQAEAAALRPLRLRIVEVGRGDTIETLASRMPAGSHKVERFTVLNGLRPGEQLQPGRKVKIVAE